MLTHTGTMLPVSIEWQNNGQQIARPDVHVPLLVVEWRLGITICWPGACSSSPAISEPCQRNEDVICLGQFQQLA